MKSTPPRLSVAERLRIALLAALAALLASVATAACGGARGDTASEAAPAPAEGAPYVPADAEFVRGMLVHHAQAVEMTDLVPQNSETEDVHLLAQRIDQTQMYEMGLMRDWLESRGEPAPDAEAILGPHGGHAGGHGDMGGMAGMASPEEMAALAEARGEAFDRMFLELMIRHHEGALTMLDELHSHDGAGLEPELYVLISHIDADQRAEIARMRRMLNTLGGQG